MCSKQKEHSFLMWPSFERMKIDFRCNQPQLFLQALDRNDIQTILVPRVSLPPTPSFSLQGAWGIETQLGTKWDVNHRIHHELRFLKLENIFQAPFTLRRRNLKTVLSS